MSSVFDFPSATPESQGLSSRSILRFLDVVEEQRIGVQSLVMLRHGRLIAEGYWSPFAQDKMHRIHSAGKAVCMFGILFMMQEGRISADTKMTEIFPDKMPPVVDEKLARLNLGHLLSMSTGHDHDTFPAMLEPGADRIAAFFAQPLTYEPGIHFFYNNGVPDMLQYILHRVTGEDLFSYLKPRLFDPLHMSHYHAEDNGELVELPTMAFETRDLAKFTYLLARHGIWEGRQLIREDLARAAVAYHMPSTEDPTFQPVGDHAAGYCWQIWRNLVGGFRIDGGLGQLGVGIPEADLVVAINSSEGLQDAILQVLWEQVEKKLYGHPIPEDPEGFALLQERLRKLTWAPKSSAEPAVDWAGSYTLSEPLLERTSLRLEEADGAVRFTLDGRSLTAPLDGTWGRGTVPFQMPELRTGVVNGRVGALRLDIVGWEDATSCYAGAAWVAPDTLDLHLCSDGWTSFHVFRFTFDAEGVKLTHLPGMAYAMENRDDRYYPPYLRNRPGRRMDPKTVRGRRD